MGKITDALKKVADEKIARIDKKPEVNYVVKHVDNSNIEQHIVAFHDPSSPIGEQYKMLRTNIQTAKYTHGFKTFVVTSSIVGEGKTVSTINLAITMANDLNNKKVLLIDADMRKCRVARYLGISHEPGLAEVLQGKATLETTLVSPKIDQLSVLPAGRSPRNPSELLNSHAMDSLLETAKKRFDYIFIDTPPVMPIADACILGPLADGVLIVAQAGRTQRDTIQHAQARLEQARAKTLGYIITNIEFHLPQYLYRYTKDYSHYSYYKEGKGKDSRKETAAL